MKNELQKRILSSLILIPIAIFFIIKGSIIFIFFLSILFLATSYEWAIMSKKNNVLKFLGIIFLLISFYTTFEFRNNVNYNEFLFIITICIFTDIGGYTFGKMLKGPKLTKISPKKTYAGVFGSFLLSFIAGSVFYKIYGSKMVTDEDLIIFVFIIFISLISQTGDLIISYFKRKAMFKDTGKIIPGHGGLLDRIDGMIFVFPFCYLILIL